MMADVPTAVLSRGDVRMEALWQNGGRPGPRHSSRVCLALDFFYMKKKSHSWLSPIILNPLLPAVISTPRCFCGSAVFSGKIKEGKDYKFEMGATKRAHRSFRAGLLRAIV